MFEVTQDNYVVHYVDQSGNNIAALPDVTNNTAYTETTDLKGWIKDTNVNNNGFTNGVKTIDSGLTHTKTIVLKHIYDPLPPLDVVNPDIPEAVERVILKALAKDPEDRFATAVEMVEALKQSVDVSGQSAEEARPAVQVCPELKKLAKPAVMDLSKPDSSISRTANPLRRFLSLMMPVGRKETDTFRNGLPPVKTVNNPVPASNTPGP